MHGLTGDAQLRATRDRDDHARALDLADLVMDMAVVSADESDDPRDGDGHNGLLQLPPPQPSARNGDAASSVSFVVALFCDGFVCRHWTRKSGWIEGFAQSYDATSRYFLDCLEKERLPDGLLELMDPTTPSNELCTEIWDLRAHPTALCPLTSADLPRTAPLPSEISGVTVRQVVLQPRDPVVLTDTASTKHIDCHPASDQFPQLSNADLEALTYDELASLALGPDSELLQVDESLALLSVDEVVGPGGECDHMNEEPVMPSTTDAIDRLLNSADCGEDSSMSAAATRVVPLIAVNDDDDHRDTLDALDLHQFITPKRISNDDLPPWELSSSSSPRAFLSPNESKARRSQTQHRTTDTRDSSDTTFVSDPFMSWPDSPSSDDDWIVKNGALRSIASVDADLALVKSEQPTSLLDLRRPAKQAKKKKDANPTSPRNDNGISLESLPPSSFHLSLSQDACKWLDSVERKSTPKKKKKKYRCLKPSIDAATPLPATHLFLSRLKGKRPRNYTIDELDHGSPAWMMMKHMTRFYQAALTFERRHAHFLQVNVERIMTAENREAEPRKLAAGSMNYIAMQLRHFIRPDQVIAAAEEAKELASPLAAEMKRWRPSAALFNEEEQDGKYSSVRSPRYAFRPGSAQFLDEAKRSPTSNLAAMTIGSPTSDSRRSKKRSGLESSSHDQSCTSPLSDQSPLTSPETLPHPSRSFVDGFDGETFEF